MQEVVGGGENPFPTDDFFILFFYFFIYKVLHRQVCNYFSVAQQLPIIAHMPLAPHSHDHPLDRLALPHTIPSPRLRSRRVWRSSLLTRIDSVSVFLCLAILTIGQNFGSNYRRSPEENFFITSRHRRGTPSQLPWRFWKTLIVPIGGKTPRTPKFWV